MADSEDQDHDDATTPAGFRPGKVANNFNMTARDLDRALGVARLSGTESFLMQVAREQSYTMAVIQGSTRPLPIAFRRAELARTAGVSGTQISDAITALLQMKILLLVDPGAKLPDRTYLINKNYAKWVYPTPKPSARLPEKKTRPTGRLLTPDQVRWCHDARKLACVDEAIRAVDEDRNFPTDEPEGRDFPTGAGRKNLGARVGKICVDETPSLPLIARAGAPGIQSNSEKETRAAETTEKPSTPAPLAPEDRAPHLLTDSERAELVAVAKLCERYFPMRDDLVRAVSTRQGAYPVAAYRAAVEKLRACKPDKHRLAYFMGIVANVEPGASGGPVTPRKAADTPLEFHVPDDATVARLKRLYEGMPR